MLNSILTKVWGTKNQRTMKRLSPVVAGINELESEVERLTDEQLRAKREEFRGRLDQGETLDDLLPEAFAVVREAGRRVLGLRHYDEQLIGGIILHQGKIAEMKTGEGKTLVATLPAYLNALGGNGVHIITVNDYLARRDAEWMGRVYRFLGASVGVIQHAMDERERQAAYGQDITYGTNSEFGFDYLRDNMKYSPEAMVQRGHAFCIVDEVDSILIDEARTPLIISGPAEHSSHGFYPQVVPVVKRLRDRQSNLIGKLLDRIEPEAEQHGGEIDDATLEALLKVKRGDPKNRRFLDLLATHGALKKRLGSLEGTMRTQKMLSDLDETLYVSIDEESNVVDFSDLGREVLSGGDEDAFVVLDVTEAMAEIEGDETLSAEERVQRKAELEKKDIERRERIHAARQLVKAFWMFEKDVHYVIKNGEVVIVDEFTGRMMPGRRWSDGLHQAVEAKEGVKIERENQTLATITLQNYFRMYEKLSGMTGTADTEAPEFAQIYDLDVVVIPTHRPMVREDQPDLIYRTEPEKWKAVSDEIARLHESGQPVLVGTITVDKSEKLSAMLKRRGVPHVVLNAKYHEREAEIVAQAGSIGAVTIATNMAGRGTDILLGGNPEFLARKAVEKDGIKPGEAPEEEWSRAVEAALEHTRASCREEHDRVVDLGGLYILGTERHESRRIDDQLRGRSGRQGDPGESRFFLSLEDDLMRIFAGDRLRSAMKTLGMEEGVPIESGMVTNSVRKAQKQVEKRHFETRQHLVKYDDVGNKQRQEVYGLRRDLLEGREQREYIFEKAREILDLAVEEHVGIHPDPADWDIAGLNETLLRRFGTDLDREGVAYDTMGPEELAESLWAGLEGRYTRKEERVGPEIMRQYERHILLQVIDAAWKDHLLALDHLKEGIGLRAYGQKDPLVEYKRESFEMFGQMKERIENEAVRYLFVLEPMTAEERERQEEQRRAEQARIFAAASRSAAGVTARGGVQQVKRKTAKVGRNDPCPCGSGKKYKKCHGAAGAA